MDAYTLMKLRAIMKANKSKTFVDRMMNPSKYPRLDLGDGNYATHKMAYMQVGDKYHVFPTILYDGKQLKEYKPRDAYNYVRQTGNYIEFDTREDAELFSTQYKKALGWE